MLNISDENRAVLEELQQRVAAAEASELLLKLGYTNPSEAVLQRLKQIAEDNDCGLSQAFFDYRYTRQAFYSQLAELLALDKSAVLAAVQEQLDVIAYERAVFKPTLSAQLKCGYRLGSWVRAAAFYSLGRVTLEKDFWRLPLAVQIEQACLAVQKHWLENKTKLESFGEIGTYVLQYSESDSIAIAVEELEC